MSALKHLASQTGDIDSVADRSNWWFGIPPNFFSITIGLAGLAGVWCLAANNYMLPAAIGNALYLIAAVVYLLLLVAFALKLFHSPTTVVTELTHPVLGPFYAALSISGMLLALGLEPFAHTPALVLFNIFFSVTILFGGWITGQWIVGEREADMVHPGYFLPTVAGSFVAADGAARFGLIGLGWMSFGIGLICWFAIGSIILSRLFLRPSLPPTLMPTLAIEVAPAVVGGNAYFTLTGGRVDTGAYLLAGYAVLMVLVQVRLIPIYMQTPFTPSFWSFTFSYAAVAANAMRWITIEQPTGGTLLSYLLLTAITALIGGIALLSLIALRQGTFISAS